MAYETFYRAALAWLSGWITFAGGLGLMFLELIEVETFITFEGFVFWLAARTTINKLEGEPA